MRILIALVAMLSLAPVSTYSEESPDALAREISLNAVKPPKPIKQTTDGRKLFDKSVTVAKINSEASSSGMVLTSDGSGKATWSSLGSGGVIASDIIGNVTGSVTGTAANVTGIVAIANGGTGSATQNFVDLTTNQTASGNKTFSGTFNVSTSFTVEARPLSTGGLNNFIGQNAGAVNKAGLGRNHQEACLRYQRG